MRLAGSPLKPPLTGPTRAPIALIGTPANRRINIAWEEVSAWRSGWQEWVVEGMARVGARGCCPRERRDENNDSRLIQIVEHNRNNHDQHLP